MDVSVVGYRCPECGREGQVAGSYAGKRGRCPGCQSWLRVSRGHCRSSASGSVGAETRAGPAQDPDLGACLLALERVPVRLLDLLAGLLVSGLLFGAIGLLSEARLAQVSGTVLLAAAALVWAVIESRSGCERLVLAELGLRLPGGEALRWSDVLTLERGRTAATRWLIHSLDGDRSVAAGFCMIGGEHWARLLWPPQRERAHETLHRRAARALRLASEPLPQG